MKIIMSYGTFVNHQNAVMRNKNAISLRIKGLRKSLDYTQSEFARTIYVGLRTLASWESGEINPPKKKIQIMLELCSELVPESVLHYFPESEWRENFISVGKTEGNLRDSALDKHSKNKALPIQKYSARLGNPKKIHAQLTEKELQMSEIINAKDHIILAQTDIIRLLKDKVQELENEGRTKRKKAYPRIIGQEALTMGEK